MRLTIKFVGLFLPLLLFLLLESGCTCALWTNGNLVAYKEPAQNPDLHVFQSTQRNDFLVVYHEHSERTDSIHTRAYWLNKNQGRVECQKAPVFAHHDPARHLSAVPVFYSPSETILPAAFMPFATQTKKRSRYSPAIVQSAPTIFPSITTIGETLKKSF